ncbi:rhodanese-like domain-containing protein [Paenibacillus sp. B01]|uniref:rhodanese-like domain-containing protein n=1 Tax=Paenibacillus sp. B01 TaxID=2660554 RepID=UPI00129A8CA7|nr:rhodanese-like domain-containing protein [Paenibacillus sp. B01]QGG56378.1 rhodanese-like domain-containing protein [Paenibacillus sp. B01]
MKSPISLVHETPAASPEEARRHFLGKLSVETDPSDVRHDQLAGLDSFLLVDVRAASAYAERHAAGAVSLPYGDISPDSTAGWPKDRLLVLYCWSPACNGAAKAGLRFSELGFRVKEMLGGIEYWQRDGFPVEGSRAGSAPVVG